MQLHDRSKTFGQKLKRAVYINNTKQIIFMFNKTKRESRFQRLVFNLQFVVHVSMVETGSRPKNQTNYYMA